MSNLSILVIDDTPASRQLTTMHLQAQGFRVFLATSGQEGVELAKKQAPALILTDLNMPDMDGFEVVQALRANPSTALTPIILITADDNQATRRTGMQVGADDFLTRPVDHQALIDAVNGQLKKYHQLLQVYHGQVDELAQIQMQLNLMIAHELRTPLITITMAHELLSRNRETLTDQQQNDLLERMGVGIHRLRHLVEQMVLMVQLETGLIDQESIAASGQTLSCWGLIPDASLLARKFDYRDKGVTLRYADHDDSILIECHPLSLKHALAELINNALKFSPEGAEVVISQEVREEAVCINILDYGQGISEENLKDAFQNYRQLKRETYEQQGIGMGLPLAKRIIEAHQGELALMSVPEKGTQAIVILPRKFLSPS